MPKYLFVLLPRPNRLHAQAPHLLRGVTAFKCGQIDHGRCELKRAEFGLFLDRARREGCCPTIGHDRVDGGRRGRRRVFRWIGHGFTLPFRQLIRRATLQSANP